MNRGIVSTIVHGWIKIKVTRITSQDIHTESSFDILDFHIRWLKQHQQMSKVILVAGKAKLDFKSSYWYKTKRLTEPIVHLRSNFIVRITDKFYSYLIKLSVTPEKKKQH